ncbi:MAG: potassium channel protein [Actinomycetota bacterium]
MSPPRTDFSVGRLPVTRRLFFALGLFVTVSVAGVIALMATQGATVGDAIYFVVITVFAVGFTEIVELDQVGRGIISAIIVLGVGSFTFLTVNVIEFLVEGHLLDLVGRRRMNRQLDALDQHMIVCGFGRVGRQVADDLSRDHTQQVVIDIDPERLHFAAERGLPHLVGNASEESVLELAGIRRAYGVAAVTEDDAENVLIALTAKLMRPDLFVVVRLKDARNTSKAHAAGADRVISPSEIGGHRIAALLTKPSVVDFLDVVTHASDVDIVLEEIELRGDAPVVGLTLATARLRDTYGINVVAIRRAGVEGLSTRPDPVVPLGAGDVLVLIGAREDLDRLHADNGRPTHERRRPDAG